MKKTLLALGLIGLYIVVGIKTEWYQNLPFFGKFSENFAHVLWAMLGLIIVGIICLQLREDAKKLADNESRGKVISFIDEKDLEELG